MGSALAAGLIILWLIAADGYARSFTDTVAFQFICQIEPTMQEDINAAARS